MESLWSEYQRAHLWRGQEWEDREHGTIVARTKLEEVYAWEDYAIKTYSGLIAEVTPAEERPEKHRADWD